MYMQNVQGHLPYSQLSLLKPSKAGLLYFVLPFLPSSFYSTFVIAILYYSILFHFSAVLILIYQFIMG